MQIISNIIKTYFFLETNVFNISTPCYLCYLCTYIHTYVIRTREELCVLINKCSVIIFNVNQIFIYTDTVFSNKKPHFNF